MSTRWVVSACCQAPVQLRYPNVVAEVALVVCACCHAVAGIPGAEDSLDVAEFLGVACRTPMIERAGMRA